MDNSEILQQAEKILGRKLRCIVPFQHLMFFPTGEVYSCCPSLVNKYNYGSVFEQNFNEIWNGEKVTEFRQSIIDGNFKFCNLNSCITLNNLKVDSRYNCDDEKWQKALETKFPKEVHFNIDVACNVRCVTCRDKKQYDFEHAKKYMEIIDSTLIPLLQNAEIVYIDGSGELFASELCRTLIKKITSTYPKIRFNIITNGILANEQNLQELGLLEKLNSVEVSLHSIKKETYNKIVRDGDYEKVMKNLKYLSKLKRCNQIPFFWLNFVVSSYNYSEMVEFQKFALEIGAMTNFWEYRKWGNAKLDEKYDEVAIFEPTHPDYDKYLKVINNKIFESENCNINAKLKPLQV